MKNLSKTASIMLILVLAVSGLIMLETTFAQSTPSIPQFTAELVDHSYDVPLTTTQATDPYTGQQVTHTSGGYHVTNKTIDVTIKNQPFTSTNIDGNTTKLFYVIRWKGHFENWPNSSDFNDGDYNYYLNNFGVQASNSEYTVKSYPQVTADGQIDFQVKAQIGFSFKYFGGHIMPIGTDFHYVAESDWSNIQTVTIGKAATPAPTSPTQPTSSPPNSTDTTQPQTSPQPSSAPPTSINLSSLDWEQIALIALAAALAVMAVGMVVLWRKKVNK